MLGGLHWVLLVGILFATAVAVAKFAARPSASRIVLATLGGFLCAAISFGVALHRCGLGVPIGQWAIPSICVITAAMLIGKAWLRRGICCVAVLLAIGLSWQYSRVVHGPDFVGVASPAPHHGIVVAKREWHTWLTGLYRRSSEIHLVMWNGPRFSVGYPEGWIVDERPPDGVRFEHSRKIAGPWSCGKQVEVLLSAEPLKEGSSLTSYEGSHESSTSLVVTQGAFKMTVSSYGMATDGLGYEESETEEELRGLARLILSTLHPR
jgi:hypothetical protein